MSVHEWASKERSSEEREDSESQYFIDIFQSLLEGTSAPKDAARDIAATCEPFIQENPNDLRIVSIWGIFSEAVRHFGSSPEAQQRLIGFLDEISKLRAKDKSGNDLKHEWAGRYWEDLPTFSLTFREYAIGGCCLP
jgi:hypothetical protein